MASCADARVRRPASLPQVISISEYRTALYEYLKNRMNAIAPNLTVMVGELVGARLIAHAGSLLSLAKHPASTVQILGAEKVRSRMPRRVHWSLTRLVPLAGSVPRAQDQARHPQVRFDLPRFACGPGGSQEQGQGQFQPHSNSGGTPC